MFVIDDDLAKANTPEAIARGVFRIPISIRRDVIPVGSIYLVAPAADIAARRVFPWGKRFLALSHADAERSWRNDIAAREASDACLREGEVVAGTLVVQWTDAEEWGKPRWFDLEGKEVTHGDDAELARDLEKIHTAPSPPPDHVVIAGRGYWWDPATKSYVPDLAEGE